MNIFFGFIAGLFTNLGISGGPILIILLTTFSHISQTEAKNINLMCYIISSLSSIILNYKKNNINLSICIPIILYGILGSFLGTYLNKNIESIISKKIFGFFLILMGFSELYTFYKHIKSKKRHTK